MITAAQEGRGMVISVEGIDEPLVVNGVPSRIGRWLTDEYFEISRLAATNEYTVEGHPVPVPIEQQKNGARLEHELSLAEGRAVTDLAFFFSSALGFKGGVELYLRAEGGDAGQVHALTALARHYGFTIAESSPVIDALHAIKDRAHQSARRPSDEAPVESRRERRLRKRLTRHAGEGVPA
jgi:hypothetical protein